MSTKSGSVNIDLLSDRSSADGFSATVDHPVDLIDLVLLNIQAKFFCQTKHTGQKMPQLAGIMRNAGINILIILDIPNEI